MKKKWWILVALVAVIGIGLILYLSLKTPEKRKYSVRKTELTTLKREIDVHINCYTSDLFALDTSHLAEGVKQLSQTYPSFLIQEGFWEDAMMIQALKSYLSDPLIKGVYNDALAVFPSMTEQEAELKDALTYYKHYFPDAEIPQFYALVPGLDFEMPSVFAHENGVFIYLDQYLGVDNKYYKQMGMPIYIKERCDKKYLAIDCFKKALVYKHLPENTLVTLLDYMIYEGKKLYFTELMFPNRTENDLIGYSQEKYEWATHYQPEIWNYIVEKQLLFSKDANTKRKFIEEAPFTKPFSNTSPGRLGIFIGWKIVQGFMENNPAITLEDLMQNTDSQSILTKSNYKPLKTK
ncbi:MAG: DUF2268 domain-containing putative Zn-dependent protease [Bacteroidales bacterium]|nr:DUF2268 domain-containing putative Zn-dependent protease [Bacteroidales bacterium]